MKQMQNKIQSNKYTRLFSNTILFGVSTFSSKVLSFFLTSLYTRVMSTASYSTVEIVVQTANLLVPLVSLGIAQAVIRFGLEKAVNPKSVFTGGLTAIGAGFAALLLFLPAVQLVSKLQGNILLLYLYVFFSCLRLLCTQFVRSQMKVRLFAIDGILSTAYTLGFTVLFLVVFQWGATGYLLAIICADALSSLFLFATARLHRYVKPRYFNKKLQKEMLRYALPLVPAAMFWWITNASDRYFIAYMVSDAENGLYMAASKLPGLVSMVASIFMEAWQLSAVKDGQGAGKQTFFTQIFTALMAVSFVGGAALIFASKFIVGFWLGADFYMAWKYVPLLVIAIIFSCLVTFLNSVYMVEKRSGLSLVTMLAGAVANLAFNALLIPRFGPNGAAFATLLSYILVFVLRAISTRQFVRIQFSPMHLVGNTLLLLGISALMILEAALWPLWCGILLAVVLWLNIIPLYRGIRQALARMRKSRAA